MLNQILEDLHNKGYSHHRHVLNSSELSLVNKFISNEKNSFSPAKVGYGAQKVRNESIRGDYTLWLNPKSPLEFLQRPTLLLGNIKEELNHHFYFGIRDYEYHLAYYPKDYFYRKHLDAFEKDSSRVVSFIFYLNEQWSEEDGGELVIYDKDGLEVLQKISPEPGSMVIFLSRDFPHEVLPCRKERRSMTGWMHNKLLE